MKLYFKPILLTGRDVGGEGSGDEGGGLFSRRAVNLLDSSDVSPLEINDAFSMDLQSVDLPVADGTDDVPSPEFAPVIEVEPIIDFVAPTEAGE